MSLSLSLSIYIYIYTHTHTHNYYIHMILGINRFGQSGTNPFSDCHKLDETVVNNATLILFGLHTSLLFEVPAVNGPSCTKPGAALQEKYLLNTNSTRVTENTKCCQEIGSSIQWSCDSSRLIPVTRSEHYSSCWWVGGGEEVPGVPNSGKTVGIFGYNLRNWYSWFSLGRVWANLFPSLQKINKIKINALMQ